MKKMFLFICFVLLSSLIFAQDNKSKSQKGADTVVKQKTYQEIIDSLKFELAYVKDDTNKVNILIALSYNYMNVEPDEGIKYGEEGVVLSQKINCLKNEAICYNNIGSNYLLKSDYLNALKYYQKSLKINEELGNKSGIAMNLGNIGNICSDQSDYPKALECFHMALKINEELGQKVNMANNLGNIAIIYARQSDYVKALEYFQKAQNIDEELGNKSGIAVNLGNIGLIYQFQSDFQKALEFYNKASKINEELGDKLGIAYNLIHIGDIYRLKSDYPKALEYFRQSLDITEELGDKSEISINLSNIGNIYYSLSNYSQALEYYHKSLKIKEEIGDKYGIAIVLGSIGGIYNNLSDYTKALEYYQKSLQINEELGRKSGIAHILGNIGIIYYEQSDNPKALEYFYKSLQINEELGDRFAVAGNLNSIGQIYSEQSDYTKAMQYFIKSLEINEELGNKSGLASTISSIGELHLLLSSNSVRFINTNNNEQLSQEDENLNKAIEHYMKATVMFMEIGEIHKQSNNLKKLSEAYTQKGDYKEALQTYKEYQAIQDSIFSMDKQKEFANLEARRENELKDKEIEIKAKENEILKQQSYNQTLELEKRNKEVALLSANQKVQKLELDKRNSELNILQKDKELADLSIKAREAETQNKEKEIKLLQANEQNQKIQIEQATYQRYALIAAILFSAIFIIFILARYREKKKQSELLAFQNAEIETQKSIVEEKNEQILASITYASTIQNAILPWKSTLKLTFGDILILYKPKDIVSGDSYWFQEVDGIKFLAVVDCTGHGIPGAMLTVIAATALDDAVLGKRLSDTGQILTYINEKVTEVLNQRLVENSIRDGMEVALIAIHKDKIQFSGAGRPLYLKNGTMEIVKTDKRGIAGQAASDEFIFSSVEIARTDKMMLYLTTDGYADQMNISSKKFSSKKFVALLESISVKPIEEQLHILERELAAHQGERSQIDDITIVGVKV